MLRPQVAACRVHPERTLVHTPWTEPELMRTPTGSTPEPQQTTAAEKINRKVTPLTATTCQMNAMLARRLIPVPTQLQLQTESYRRLSKVIEGLILLV